MFPRVISPLSNNDHHETVLLLMTTSDDIQWFAIQCRIGVEAVAESNLCALPIETLLPLVRRPVHHATRVPRMVPRPLFPGYLFAHFCAAASLRAVKYSRGVLRVVGGDEHPWPVDDEIIADIRARIDPQGCVEIGEPLIRKGDSVRITAGPLSGWAGVFDCKLSDKQRVVILIETLQQGRVVVPHDYLELSDAA